MANPKEIVYLRGKAFWFKALGEPVDNYNRDGKEWIFDLALDADGVRQVKSVKVQGKPAMNLKNKDDERGDFITLKQRAERKDGSPNRPPKVMDPFGQPWPVEEKLGNGSAVEVKIEVVDFGKGMYAGVYPLAVRVLDHVEFKQQDFAPLAEDDPYYEKAKRYAMNPREDVAFKKDFHLPEADDSLDDDIPE